MAFHGNNTTLGRRASDDVDRWWLTDADIRALWPLSRTQAFANVIADQYHMAAVNGAEIGANGLICNNATGKHASAGNVLNKHRNAISWGCWAYVASTARAVGVMGKTEATGGYRFSFGQPPDEGNIHIQSSAAFSLAAPAVDIRNAWHFVVGVFDGDAHTPRLYVDGDLAVEGDEQSGGFHSSTFPYSLGCYGANDARTMDGVIDDAFHFERTLTQAEIQQMMAAGRGRLYS